jgi:hypothetical protein
MSHDLEELHEHAEHGASDERLAPVTVSMAILAVVVAVVALMGARIHADEVLAETRATDQWAEYQAKVIRERSYEVFLDQLTVFTLQSPSQAEQLKAKYSKEIARYTSETKDLQTQATATQDEVSVLERRSNWFDFSEVLLEAGLVVSSITLLTRKRTYWYLGLASAGVGTIIAITGLFIH